MMPYDYESEDKLYREGKLAGKPAFKKAHGSLTIEQIESIEMMQIGEIFPKRLKHIKISHPLQNISGLVRINGEYFQWTSIY